MLLYDGFLAKYLSGNIVLDSGAWTPNSLSNIAQRFLDKRSFYDSYINNLPILTPEEPGTVAQPRAGRCWLFDGSNDEAVGSFAVGSTYTFSTWVKPIAAASQAIAFFNGNGSGTGAGVLVRYDGSTTLQFFPNTGTTVINVTIPNISASWNHVAVTQSGTAYAVYINGSLVQSGTTVTPLIGGNKFQLGRYDSATPLSGSMKDALIDDEAYTAGEVLSLYNTHQVPAGKTPLAFYRCEEESGTTGYNSLSNSNHLTLTNITQATFHAADTGVKYSHCNEKGYTKTLSFDGTDDYAVAPLTLSGSSSTICMWIRPSVDINNTVANVGIVDTNPNTIGALQIVRIGADAPGIRFTVGGGVSSRVSSVANWTNQWHHLAHVYDHATKLVTAYIDGVAVTQTAVNLTTAVSITFELGRLNGSMHFPGLMSGVKLYNVAKSAGEVAAIASGTNDVTGLLGKWNDQYDESGNGRNLTLTNGTGVGIIPAQLTTPTLDAAGNALGVVGPVCYPATVETGCLTFSGTEYCSSGVKLTTNNSAFSVSFWAKTSADMTICSQWTYTTNDRSWVLILTGGKFDFIVSNNGGYVANSTIRRFVTTNSFNDGVWHHVVAVFNANTLTFFIDGAVAAGSYTSTGTVNSVYNGTATFAVQATDVGGTLGIGAGGQLADLRVYSDAKTLANAQALLAGTDNRTNLVAHWTCQEGPGTASTNRTIYDTVGTNHLTVNNGTVANHWANRCPYVKDWCIQYGGGIAANGAFIPGRIGSANDAAGNAKTLSVGKFGNPYSRLNRNRFASPKLVNIGITSSDAVAPSTNVQAASVVDTQFRRNKSDGSDRYFATTSALTGISKTGAQNYTN